MSLVLILHYKSGKGYIEAELSFYDDKNGKLVKRMNFSRRDGIKCVEVKGARFSSCFKEEESDTVFEGVKGVVEKVGSRLVIR